MQRQHQRKKRSVLEAGVQPSINEGTENTHTHTHMYTHREGRGQAIESRLIPLGYAFVLAVHGRQTVAVRSDHRPRPLRSLASVTGPGEDQDRLLSYKRRAKNDLQGVVSNGNI